MIKELKWKTQNCPDGYIDGTKKVKHMDIDGTMIRIAVESIIKNKDGLSRLIIGSGDKHMLPIIESCMENAPGAKIYVIAKEESISPVLSTRAHKVMTL
jgi:hypothetical protein